ncbi:FAD-dependent oxidoreductase [Microbacterium aurantiacum]|uniref:FAD-dependent oxidoreductase n=1 Tax=Microbacterium aurantiacum TaxID=162393 RepID=A0ABT8FVN4_9MICO|nr:FAD-dependent oxidoreductase [Microbacterium aurantiacum]MDN4465371.1 FAD-dependent oxidoreductase [Microbacterium aurantiacum]
MGSAAIEWDETTDFLSIGSGIGGLAGAIVAHDWGMRALVIEKAATVGGVSTYSGGEIWVGGSHLQADAGIEDSEESAFEYIREIGAGYNDDLMTRNYCVHAPIALRYFEENANIAWRLIPDFPDYYYPQVPHATAGGRYIEVAPFAASSLGEWQTRVHLSPQSLSGVTHPEMFAQGGLSHLPRWDMSTIEGRWERDERTMGPGLGASFAKAAIDRGIPILTETPAQELITEQGRVVGVRATRDDRDYFIRAERGVLIAAGAYDWNEAAHRTYDMVPDIKSASPPSVTGDGIVLGGAVGAKLTQVPVPVTCGYRVPGEEHEGRQLWRIAGIPLGVPHSIVVNRRGRRFGDESFSRSLGFALKTIDGGTPHHPNYPFWVIQDAQARAKYDFGPFRAGAELPSEVATTAPTLRELADALGIDPDGLEDEVRRFNGFVEVGTDGDFGRGEKGWSRMNSGDRDVEGNPNLGALTQGPFTAVRLYPLNIGLSNAGLAADVHNRVLNYRDQPIVGLYTAGNSMTMIEFGAGYNSGQGNTRGMLGGYLAARHAAGDPSPALGASAP